MENIKPEKPKRPISGYFRFQAEIRQEVKDANPDTGNSEIMKLIGAKWAKFSDEDKEVYNKEFRDALPEYKVKQDGWEEKYGGVEDKRSKSRPSKEPRRDSILDESEKAKKATGKVTNNALLQLDEDESKDAKKLSKASLVKKSEPAEEKKKQVEEKKKSEAPLKVAKSKSLGFDREKFKNNIKSKCLTYLKKTPHTSHTHKPYTVAQVTCDPEQLKLVLGTPRKEDKKFIWWNTFNEEDLQTKVGFEEMFNGKFTGAFYHIPGRGGMPKFNMAIEKCDVKYFKENSLAEFKFRTYNC